MNKILLSLVVVLVAGSSLLAQSVEQGKKFYYYKRFKSAKAELEKVLAAILIILKLPIGWVKPCLK
jgi:hypothetical protein